ncbi:MAG: type II secretion system protein [Bacilli bacterium]|nr:type II secretion system protein [Bacilli bacterium]
MKNILTKKAMTLFELLAVIVILGIILAIGFPTVNRLITNSRKDAFVANVNSYISAAKTDALSEWAVTGSAVNRVYYIGDKTELIPDDDTAVQEDFGLNGFAGAVHVYVKSDGSIEFVKVIVPFSNGKLTLKEESYINDDNSLKDIQDKSFNRNDVDDVK